MQRYLVALTVCGIIDAFAYMIVGPSIIFYVLQNGGTKDHYGLVISAFPFAAFFTKPILGLASDRIGFRIPYISSMLVAILGGALYTLSSCVLPNGSWAIGGIFCSRLLMGIGAAKSVLGYAYVAQVVPHNELTSINSLLSMAKMSGMMLGPFLNVVLDHVHIELYGGKIILDPLNSVGLLMIVFDVIAMINIYFLLDEPGSQQINHNITTLNDTNNSECPKICSNTFLSANRGRQVINSFFHVSSAAFSANIFVPFLSMFVLNANFQLIETGLPPAASDGLGWGPVKISSLLGSLSIVVGVGYGTVSALSKKFSDEILLASGLTVSTIAYTLIFLLWERAASVYNYIITVGLAAASFPFLVVPTRTIFTVAVDSKPELERLHGVMQAALSMMANVAGFTVPTFVAHYCIKSPEKIDLSAMKREMSMFCLFAPILSLLTLTGVLFMTGLNLTRQEEEEEIDEVDIEQNNSESGLDNSNINKQLLTQDQLKSMENRGFDENSLLLQPSLSKRLGESLRQQSCSSLLEIFHPYMYAYQNTYDDGKKGGRRDLRTSATI